MTARHLFRTALVLAALALPSLAFAQTDLIISEYVEGTSNNKSIELFNPTGSAIDMGAGVYKLRLFSNGSLTVSAEVLLTGTVASGATYVISHASASAAILGVSNATSSTVINFNGDDAIVLTKSAANTVVDAFGQVGLDPGTEWGTGLQSTADNTLRRAVLVCDGDTNASDAFDPTIQWVGFATDTFGGLGAHSVGCGPTPTHGSTWGRIKTLYR